MRSGAIRNAESARVSIIGQLKKMPKSSDQDDQNVLIGNQSHAVMTDEIAEEDEEDQHEIIPRQNTPLSDQFRKPEPVNLSL